MTRRTAAYASLISALLFVIVLMSLVVFQPGIPVLWLLLVIPACGGAWFLRQAVAPDKDAPPSWRVRNALGCVFAGMGVPVLFMLVASDALFPGTGPDAADRQGLGLLVLLGILAGLGALVTLLWGVVNWTVSVVSRG